MNARVVQRDSLSKMETAAALRTKNRNPQHATTKLVKMSNYIKQLVN